MGEDKEVARGTAPALLMEGVSLRLGGRALLEDVGLRVAVGETVAIAGPSGAGKTTLLHLVHGMQRPDRGVVRVHGEDVASLGGTELRNLRSRIGFIHQDHALVPTLRVHQNVIAGRAGRRSLWSSTRALLWPTPEDLEQAHLWLERVGIADKLYHRTDTLSVGEQQRVAIARALFQGPRILLADEPTASVDPARSKDVIQMLIGLAREAAVSLVVSLHDVELARGPFDRVVGLRDGRVQFDMGSDEVDDARWTALYRLEGRGVEGTPGAPG